MSGDVTHPELGDDAMAVHASRYSDLCPVCKERALRGQRITALHRSLVEFGYSSLTRDEVAVAYDKALAGEPDPADIIHLMVGRQMRDAGLIA